MPDPVLILVSGPPAAGKTTLARRIAAEFSLPVIGKDGIKELLFDNLGGDDWEQSQKLGRASVALLFDFVGRLLAAGVSVVAESNFHSLPDSERVERLRAQYHFRPLQIHCTAATEVLMRRFAQRDESRERHPGHLGLDWRTNWDTEVWRPLQIAGQTLIVDTTDFGAINHAAVFAAVRQTLLTATTLEENAHGTYPSPETTVG